MYDRNTVDEKPAVIRL